MSKSESKSPATSPEFKSVRADSGVTYLKPADLADRQVEGIFEKIVEGKFGKNYQFKTSDGTVIVNGCGALHGQMEKVNEGDLIRLVYGGQKKITEGAMKGKSFHDIDVRRA